MKFTIVAYPSKFSEIGFNYLLVRVRDGEIVGMIEECAVDDMKQVLGNGYECISIWCACKSKRTNVSRLGSNYYVTLS